MKNMSFSLTTAQMRARTKTVTRRLGWHHLKPGDLVCAVVKGMGLKRGEKVERIGVIRVLSVRLESLHAMRVSPLYGRAEAIREGFPEMEGSDFVKMFTEHN